MEKRFVLLFLFIKMANANNNIIICPKPKKLKPSNSSPVDNLISGKNQDQEILFTELTGSKILRRFNL